MWHGAGRDNAAGGVHGQNGLSFNSLLHNDHWENMFFVASGTKNVSLFDSRLASALYEIKRIDKTSPVDIDMPDFEQFPSLRSALAHRVHVVVQEGDLLYIPLFWFHQVYTDRRAVAISLWWDVHGLQQHFPNEGSRMGTQELLDALLGQKWQKQASMTAGKVPVLHRRDSNRTLKKNFGRQKQCPTRRGLLSSTSLADLPSCKRGHLCKVPNRRHEHYLSL